MDTRANTSFLLSITIVSAFLLYACRENNLPSGGLSNNPVEKITGSYYFNGSQINKSMCYFSSFCEPGEVVYSDTLQVTFELKVEAVYFTQDTVLVTGLPGADRDAVAFDGKFGAAAPDCEPYSWRYACPYARVHSDSLIFKILSPGGRYQATGLYNNGMITLNARYFYRGIEIDFNLSGLKTE